MNLQNLSPRQLALFTAIVLGIPVSIGAYLLRPDWPLAIMSAILFISGAYALILAVLQRFIYRKIKLIYKLIYKTKASKKEELYYKYVLPQKGIDEVKDDVMNWATRQIGELDTLRSNERYRREFLQNLAHEIKTPVFAIQAYLDALRDEDEDTETKARFLVKAGKNVDRMVSLLKDMDVIAGLETGEVPLLYESFLIQDLIKDVYELLQLKAHAKEIHLLFKKSGESQVTVYADKERIRQVLINLCTNSIKYTAPNGKVTASIYRIDGEKALIEISDNGYGIAEEHLGRIFERFYRTDEARNRKIGGSGLGLAICKHIIEAHGQAIHVRSKPNVGTTIGFTLSTVKPGNL